MLLVQVDNLIIPPPMTPEDYLRQLEAEGLGEEDRAQLEQVRREDQTVEAQTDEEMAAAEEEAESGLPAALQHIFQKHFRQGRFLVATDSEAAAARVIRDLGFAGFVNSPAAFISLVGLRPVEEMVVMQASALTEWFAEVDTPVGKVYGLHYPATWVNLPAPVEDPTEHAVAAIMKKIMLNSAPLASTDRHFPEADASIRWVTPKTHLRIDFDDRPSISDPTEVLAMANSVTAHNLHIRRIAGGDLLLAETCRPLFPEFFAGKD